MNFASGIVTIIVAFSGVALELLLKVASRPDRTTQANTVTKRLKERANLTPEDWVMWQQLVTMGSVACGSHLVAKTANGETLDSSTVWTAMVIAVGGFLAMTFLMRVGVYDGNGSLPSFRTSGWGWIIFLNILGAILVIVLSMLGVMS